MRLKVFRAERNNPERPTDAGTFFSQVLQPKFGPQHFQAELEINAPLYTNKFDVGYVLLPFSQAKACYDSFWKKQRGIPFDTEHVNQLAAAYHEIEAPVAAEAAKRGHDAIVYTAYWAGGVEVQVLDEKCILKKEPI